MLHNALMLIIPLVVEVSTFPQKICGENLSKILSAYCLSYPEHRVRREVAHECCRDGCSRDYLVKNYCQTYNSEALMESVKVEELNTIKTGGTTRNENQVTRHLDTAPSPYVNNLLLKLSENDAPTYPGLSTENDHNPEWKLSSVLSHHDNNLRKTQSKCIKLKNYRSICKTQDWARKKFAEAKLGEVENYQKPIYIFKHKSRLK